MLQCQDGFYTTFGSYPMMRDYHEKQSKDSQWVRCKVNELQIEPLDANSPLYSCSLPMAPGVTRDAVDDTAENLGLAMDIDGAIILSVPQPTKVCSTEQKSEEPYFRNLAVRCYLMF